MKNNQILVAALALAAIFSGAAGTGTVGMAAATRQATAVTIGERMPDGTIYAGVSPETGKAMYTTPEDAHGAWNWNSGAIYCANLQADGHHDWRAPSKNELNVLFDNRAAIGGFNKTGSYPAGWYGSASQSDNHNYAWHQRFSDGKQMLNYKSVDLPLRCVRG